MRMTIWMISNFERGDIGMMKSAAAAAVAVAAVALGAPALAKSHKHRHGFAQAPEAVVPYTGGPQFIRVGPNGYWVTTTWGCWVDDGQGRIHDCSGGAGGTR
jgi:hypothetical protein